LGKWKLEGKISKGYFFANKMYHLIYENGKTDLKAKGIKLKNFLFNKEKNNDRDFINALIKNEGKITLINNDVFKRKCDEVVI
jgi:hypothetical protein